MRKTVVCQVEAHFFYEWTEKFPFTVTQDFAPIRRLKVQIDMETIPPPALDNERERAWEKSLAALSEHTK